MANLSFNDVEFNQNNNNENTVGFFSLTNDGDEAIVRFIEDSVDTFDLVSTHNINLNGKYRKINCLRSPKDPIDNCPFCSNNDNPSTRIFIKLIEYVRNADGTVTAFPKVWERSINYAKTLKSYIDNYGPLSDIICKIIRHGAKGSMQTTYEIVPNLNKSIYPDNVYQKDITPFENYKALGRIVLDKNYEEIVTFLNTGIFPEKPTNADNQQRPVQQFTAPNMTTPPINYQPQYPANSNQQFNNQPQYIPMDFPTNNQPQVSRPNRTY